MLRLSETPSALMLKKLGLSPRTSLSRERPYPVRNFPAGAGMVAVPDATAPQPQHTRSRQESRRLPPDASEPFEPVQVVQERPFLGKGKMQVSTRRTALDVHCSGHFPDRFQDIIWLSEVTRPLRDATPRLPCALLRSVRIRSHKSILPHFLAPLLHLFYRN